MPTLGPRRTWSTALWRLGLALVVSLALVFACAGWGVGYLFGSVGVWDPFTGVVYTGGASPTHPSQMGLVDFRVPVNQATAILANVGVFPYFPCTLDSFYDPNAVWTSPADGYGENGYSDSGIHSHSLWVYAPLASGGFGPAAPADWATRLAANPAVDFVETGDVTFNCGLYAMDQHRQPNHPYYLAAAAEGPPSYLQVEFSASTTYDDAVAEMIGQGLRLANPCAERVRAPWAPLGQGASYDASQTLTVALTIASSTLWAQQLHALPNVVAVRSAYNPSC